MGQFRTDGLKMSAAVLVTWLALLGPVCFWSGTTGLLAISCAAALCLVPGWVSLGLLWRMNRAGNAIGGLLSGIGLRLAVAAGGAVVLAQQVPRLQSVLFCVSLAVFYIVVLAMETRSVLALEAGGGSPRRPAARPPLTTGFQQ